MRHIRDDNNRVVRAVRKDKIRTYVYNEKVGKVAQVKEYLTGWFGVERINAFIGEQIPNAWTIFEYSRTNLSHILNSFGVEMWLTYDDFVK